jgi:four helix bundle protein
VHKLKIALKELRETRVWLRIIVKAELIAPRSKLEPLIAENEQLIAIFVKSIKTATANKSRQTAEQGTPNRRMSK